MLNLLTTLPTDSFVGAAFAELLEDVTSLLSAAQAQKPSDKAEISFWRAQFNALNKAESYWAQGVRPTLSSSAYLLSSASRPGALVHRLSRVGGIVVCSCEAGVKGTLCWHHMLINVIERAAELESLAAQREEITSDPTPDAGPNPIPHAVAAAQWLGGQITLQARLSATAQLLTALRAAQGRRALRSDPPIDIPDQYPDPAPGDEPPVWPAPNGRRLGLRLVAARKKSAAFASAFYLEAA